MFDPFEIGQMTTSKVLPTVFAKNICKEVDLLNREDCGPEFLEQVNRLQQFQQMSISCRFEQAKIAYHGIDLDEQQLKSLKLIYDTTKPWLQGHVVGAILDRINSKTTSNKDFSETVRTILEKLDSTDESNDKGGVRRKELIVKLSKSVG